ncbi:uncharacterized protein CLUP02_05979 [Colletotrichum lupini]|uniref:Uncharacterized protein n=1 Tax=Colletotrichum lupini TaxID=145971 RepID=A0A9Q8WEP9_9PEZI|nr:uncharacterized protein CLUP02_05979 [Colletotrichum lupini]UQC80496.1 hypothetical protein CLUP02_05979 [Colletotrichum lupini]
MGRNGVVVLDWQTTGFIWVKGVTLFFDTVHSIWVTLCPMKLQTHEYARHAKMAE